MKKLNLVLLSAACISLSACNQNIGFGELEFKGIHVQLHETNECFHYKIDSWHESSVGIEIKTYDHGSFFLCEGSYAMFTNNYCPVCGKEVLFK